MRHCVSNNAGEDQGTIGRLLGAICVQDILQGAGTLTAVVYAALIKTDSITKLQTSVITEVEIEIFILKKMYGDMLSVSQSARISVVLH